MNRWANNQIYKNVILIWLVISVASVFLSSIAWRRLHDTLKRSREAVAIKETSNAILTQLVDSETGERGFALTGDDAFLEPLTKAEAALPPQFEKLVALVQSNTNLMNQVLNLRAQSEGVMDYNRRVIAERRQKGINAAAEMVKQGDGKKLMDQIRGGIAVITSSREDLNSIESETSHAQLLRANLTSMVAAMIGLCAGLLALYLAAVSSAHARRETELVKARTLAERESREKSTFLANMSHEIRTPMNAILGFSELLFGELTESKQRGYVQSIRTSAMSLLQLINDLLDMSKVEAGMVKLRPEPTDPREICDFIKVVFSGPAARRNIKLECHVADDLPRALLLDRVRLRQILVNLVSNAVKFTDHGSVILTVGWEKQGESTSRITLILEVQDTGVGIPKDRIEAIFKPFVQAGTHQEKERGGSGLGLSIVQNLVHLMGGTVTVASVVGQGSAFHLRFPGVPVSVRLPAAEPTEPDAAPDFNELKPSKILVVDDNETNCRLLGGMFEGSHHQIEFGRDGRDAVYKCRTFRPNLVLLDIRMPEMNGYEAVAEIRKVPGMDLLPVIAVTASSLADEENALQEKFNAHLRKPFTRHQLFGELSQFLPKVAKTEPLEPSPAPAGGSSPAWRPLVTQLRGIEAGEWPGLRDSLAINESRDFARKLEKLARDANCAPLQIYADAMTHYAETYAVDDLEKHLYEFPALIDRIENAKA